MLLQVLAHHTPVPTTLPVLVTSPLHLIMTLPPHLQTLTLLCLHVSLMLLLTLPLPPSVHLVILTPLIPVKLMLPPHYLLMSVDELLNSILSLPSSPSPDGYTNVENVEITSSPTNERQFWLQTQKGKYMQDCMYILNESFTLLYRSDRCKKQNV